MTPSTPTLPLAALLALAATPACTIISPDLLEGNRTIDAPPGAIDAPPQGEIDAPPPPPPDAAVLTPREGLVAEYLFEDSATTQATDTAPRALHATLSEVGMSIAAGRNGRGIRMSGAQYVSLPNGMLTGVNDFTIATWVRVAANTAWSRIYDIGNGLADPDNRFMYLTVFGYVPFSEPGVPNGLQASSWGGSRTNENYLGTKTYLPLTVWKHVAVTGSTGNRTIWIDGFPAVAVTNGPAIAPSEMEPIFPNSWLGRSRSGDAGFAGDMDEFRVYDRVLTTSEIADLAWPGADYSH